MALIHHATAARAAKLGFHIEAVDHNLFIVTKGQTELARAATARDALQLAEKASKPAKTERAPKAKKAGAKKARKARNTEDEDSEDGDEEDGTESKSVIKAKYKAKYRPNKDTNGDEMRKAISDFIKPDGEDVDPRLFYQLAKTNGVDGHRWDDKKTKHGAWNVGMASMNLGNVFRGKMRRGENVTISGKVFKGAVAKKA